MKKDCKYTLVKSHGLARGFEVLELDKKDFLREAGSLLQKPKKIFLGLGDFLEVGDYNQLIDSVLFDRDGVMFENILDRNNRKMSMTGEVPFSFFKLAVYYPDFLLRDVPTSCVSAVGAKSRLYPGAENFVQYIRDYDPIVISALPLEMAAEFVRRLGLDERNLISTLYRVKSGEGKRDVYAGGVHRFISGDRKTLEIEKYMEKNQLADSEVVYIGRGEAGMKTFATVNSIAFNPSRGVIPESRITLYGSSIESLLVLFNFQGELDRYLAADNMEVNLPSLVVHSDHRDKSPELIDLELKHLRLQNNVIGQRLEYVADSFPSMQREIEISFGGSSMNLQEVRDMISQRMSAYRKNPQELVRRIYSIARERYKNFYSS